MKEEKMNPNQELNGKIYNYLNKQNIIIKGLYSLHNLTCPEIYNNGLIFFLHKREKSKAPNVRKYWENKISSLFYKSMFLLDVMNPEDEEKMGITKKEIREVLELKMGEYDFINFSQKIKKRV